MSCEKDIVMLSGEPYLSDDVRFKSDPETYIWQEEMSNFMAWVDKHGADGSWWLMEQNKS